MRKREVICERNPVPRASAQCGRAPLADAIDCQDGRVVERTRKEGARRMAFVVVGINDRRLDVTQGAANRLSYEQLLSEPDRQRCGKTWEASGREREVSLEEALELAQRLLVERDVVEIARLEMRFAQAVIDGARWKRSVVLFAREPFFLCSRDNFSIDDQRCGAVVIESRDSENGRHQRPFLADDASGVSAAAIRTAASDRT